MNRPGERLALAPDGAPASSKDAGSDGSDSDRSHSDRSHSDRNGAEPSGAEPRPAGPDAAGAPRRTPLLVWLLPGLLTFAACLIGIGYSVLWQDELATVSAASRSLPDLARLVMHRDGVHALYYTIVHLWTAGFGVSPVSVRMPSALAAAGWAACTALLGARLFGPRAGLVAGLLITVVPATSRFGMEARPYVLAALVATVSTLLLVDALRRPAWWRWCGYGAAIVLLGYLQLTACTLLAAHAVAVAYLWQQERGRQERGRRVPARWAAAVAAAVVLLLPIFYVGSRQSGQVGWISDPTWRSVLALPGLVFLAPVVGGLIMGVALGALQRRNLAVVLAAAVATVPLVLFVLVSLQLPVMLPRYLLFTVLGWVLLAAAGVDRLGPRGAGGLLLAVLLLGLPTQVDARGLTRSDRPDFRGIAAVMAGHERPGDAMVVPDAGGARFRIGIQVYLPAQHRPADVLAARTPAQAGSLDSPACDPARCLGSPARIWVGCSGACTDPLRSLAPPVRAAIRSGRYRRQQTWAVAGGAISLYARP